MFNFFSKRAPSSPFLRLDSEEAFQNVLRRSRDEVVIIFKHSILCGISSMARNRVAELTGDEDPPVYEVVIQEHRSVSDRIATYFGIRHQSPQAIVLYRERPVHHCSHGQITAEALRRAAREALRETLA